jgi:hypothetical protein
MTTANTENLSRIRVTAWSASATLTLLPLLTLKLADPRAWDFTDLPLAFIMIAAVGAAFEIASRVPTDWAYRTGAALAAGAALLLIAGNLAVGFAGSEDNVVNILFFAIPVIVLAGALAVRFRSAGLATTMACAAAAQLAAGLVVFYHGYFTGPLTVAFTGLWLSSSLAFLRSSRASVAGAVT